MTPDNSPQPPPPAAPGLPERKCARCNSIENNPPYVIKNDGSIERMLGMKQDDWLAACREIDEKDAKIAALAAALNEAYEDAISAVTCLYGVGAHPQNPEVAQGEYILAIKRAKAAASRRKAAQGGG